MFTSSRRSRSSVRWVEPGRRRRRRLPLLPFAILILLLAAGGAGGGRARPSARCSASGGSW